MKLLDLIKSLTNGTVADPDGISPPTIDQSAQLLDELTAIAALLDTPPAAPVVTATTTASPITPSLLDIPHIFDDDSAAIDCSQKNNDPLPE